MKDGCAGKTARALPKRPIQMRTRLSVCAWNGSEFEADAVAIVASGRLCVDALPMRSMQAPSSYQSDLKVGATHQLEHSSAMFRCAAVRLATAFGLARYPVSDWNGAQS